LFFATQKRFASLSPNLKVEMSEEDMKKNREWIQWSEEKREKV